MRQDEPFDAIILGAGAAGLMAARTAGLLGQRVLVLDHADRPGKKILISGGGRCNFTNIHTAPDRFLSANPHFVKSALGRYQPQDFIDLVERYGISWHEKTLGQLFCDGSSRQIVDMLLDECAQGQVDIRCDHRIVAVDRPDGRFRVSTQHGAFIAPALVIATGGPSIPKMGATGFGYDLARQFNLKVIEPRPALVPLTLSGDDMMFRGLSGIAVDSVAAHGKTRFREASLFTHKGLSGPAILQISSYWRPGEAITINLLPDSDAAAALVEAKRQRPKLHIHSLLGEWLPDRLVDLLRAPLGLSGELANIADKALIAAGNRLNGWRFTPNGSEGFAKAEVTVGGVDTSGLSSRTMEARSIPGLYFIGEAVDVTGWLGGYNFQWAWASGNATGEAIAQQQ
ncbi:NAD(P)/FAD-dependent oxidoreductase [Sphingomonas sp. C3-2]|uniref:NAD(P)/FAD-dependent oxidoreductase n=1 Tax=Sphingomonas sp. C3-2 TaxID=3062169 RepID=UPI00294AB43A|nr:NAD(P)/FAD-dependent oxidoreductase [Sphingomonas sp. C3-2]WOK36992.1 NAD(P)/FAD-dependent oxidoreductase [Sphingomonas sp. C3-2]